MSFVLLVQNRGNLGSTFFGEPLLTRLDDESLFVEYEKRFQSPCENLLSLKHMEVWTKNSQLFPVLNWKIIQLFQVHQWQKPMYVLD
jgi:hypothetical protein